MALSISLRAMSIRDFMRLEAAGGIVLVIAAAVALVLANSPAAWLYEALLEVPAAVQLGGFEIRKPLLLWLNDGWMAVFFFLVGLEIKREFAEGELSNLRAAGLPIIGAVGGMLVPALIYASLNIGRGVDLHGWAIPTATDIAFALGVMSLLGSRVPATLKVLLTAIAIIDDLGAIVIIAAFYTADLSLASLGLAALAILALAALNLSGVRQITPYVLVGGLLWIFVLKSGVHATLAGVITALAIPLKGAESGEVDDEHASPLRWLEHVLHPWVAFLVLPAFAFANAGVSFEGLGLGIFGETVTLGIALGLLIGKPIGVFGAIRLAVATGLGRLPADVTWTQILGLSVLCGIGFTMSLFIGGLAFADTSHAAQVRLGVLSGSIISALIGYVLLARSGPKPNVAAPISPG